MKNTARYAILAALFIIPFLALFVPFGMFFPFITGKGFGFRILVEIALAAYAVLACIDAKYRPKFSWTLVLYGALVVWMFIADSFAVNAHKAFWSNYERMDGFVTLIHVFAFFVIAGSVLTVDTLWRKWWLTFLGAAALVDAYSLLQLMGLATIHQGGVRVDATFGNAAYLAAYLIFVTAIALWQGLISRGWLRYALFALAAISALVIYETQTRGAVLGLLVGAVAAAFLWMFETGKKGKGIAAGIIVVLLLLAGGIYAVRDSDFVHNNPTLNRVTSISSHDLSVRFTLWGMALRGTLERPVTGWGQDGFNYVFQQQYEPKMYSQEPWFDRGHNTFIDWMVAGGFPALLLFLALLGSSVVALYRKTASRPERVMLVAALAAYAVQALVVFDNLFTYIPLAALLAAAHIASSRSWTKLEKLPTVRTATVNTYVAPAALIVGVLVIWFVNVPSIVAANESVTALSSNDPAVGLAHFKMAIDQHGLGSQEVHEQLVTYTSNVVMNAGVSQDAKQALVAYAVPEMQAEVDRVPKDARFRIQYATFLRSIGDLPHAMEQSAIARSLAPKKQTIMIEQGYEQLQAGQFAAARETYNTAYQLDTSFPDLAAYAAAGDIFSGDVAAGQKTLLAAYGTTTVDNQILVYAYYQAKRYNDLVTLLELHARTDDSVEAHLRLASGYAVAGRLADARAEAERTLVKHPEAAQQITAFLQSI